MLLHLPKIEVKFVYLSHRVKVSVKVTGAKTAVKWLVDCGNQNGNLKITPPVIMQKYSYAI